MKTTKDLAKRYNVCTLTIGNWRKNGWLPAPVIISPRCVRWREQDLAKFEQYLADRENAKLAGYNPDTAVPEPDYTLPLASDAFQVGREQTAAQFEPESTDRRAVEQLHDELVELAKEAAHLAVLQPKTTPEQVVRLRGLITADYVDEIAAEMTPENAARLKYLLATK